MMTANVRKVFAIALVLVALVSIFVPAASAGARQLWYFCPNAPGGDLEKYVCGTGPNVILDGKYYDWGAGPAECALSMGKGTWTVHLDYTAPSGGGQFDKICIHLHSDFNPHLLIGEATNVAITGGAGTKDVDIIGADNVDFVAGDHILLVLWWNAGKGDITINCGDGKSTLTGPDSDPGFPVPELSTLALFSVGLLALVGYVGYRRRQI